MVLKGRQFAKVWDDYIAYFYSAGHYPKRMGRASQRFTTTISLAIETQVSIQWVSGNSGRSPRRW